MMLAPRIRIEEAMGRRTASEDVLEANVESSVGVGGEDGS